MSKIAAVSVSQLIALTGKMMHPSARRPGRVAYEMAGKADSGSCAIPGGLAGDSNDVRAIDCSGFVRFSAAKCSGQACQLPDGSATIHEFCAAENLPRVLYSAVATGQGRLFLAFIAPAGGEAGHVWWVHGGMTMESHGGAGVDRRSWDTPVLRRNVCACYVFPSAP